MKEFTWRGNTVQITKKKIKNAHLRIKPDTPQIIRISIPYSMSYDAAARMLEEPRVIRWVENYQKKVSEKPAPPRLMDEEKTVHEPYYRKRLCMLLPDMFRKWERILGVKCRKVTIRDTRSQWGSCSIRTKNISISVWLGAFPEECVEYVVVHELVHLLEAGHNARFYGLLDQYYPNWENCRKQLKNGVSQS